MSSFTYTILTTVGGVLGACLVGALSICGHFAKEKESNEAAAAARDKEEKAAEVARQKQEQATKSINDLQVKHASEIKTKQDEIKSLQTKLANDAAEIKGKEDEIKALNTRIEATGNKSAANIELILRSLHIKINETELWKLFPYGYVLFSDKKEDIRQVYPAFNRGEAIASPIADWKDVKILLDRADKSYTVVVPYPKWPQAPQLVINGAAMSKYHYELNKPDELRAVHMANGLPNMYLYVIDDEPNHEVCVIGFKK